MKNIIIGAGPGGRLAANELGKLGEEVLLIEKRYIAGTCLNEGCMVICALNDVAKFLNTSKRFEDLGIITANIDFSYEKVVEKIKETQAMLRKIEENENKSVGNEIIYGEAEVEIGENNEINVKVNGDTYQADNLLIATGARPFIPNILGVKHALTSSDILKLKELPDTINIIGGGIIACELSNIFTSYGSEVNILARSSVLKNLEPEIKDYTIRKLLKKVNIYENTNINEIQEDKVITSSGTFIGKTLIATGRTPNSEAFKNIVDLNDDGSIKVDKMMKTSHPNIYAAGDVTGGIQLTPVARREGLTAARNMAGYSNAVHYKNTPEAISLDLDVSFIKNDTNNTDENEIRKIVQPGGAGPGAFWRLLTSETGLTSLSINKKTNKVENASAISPSSVSDTAYMAFLINLGITKEDFDEFLELHPSTDTYYKILKYM
ncbi:MAG: NAD(P)/FAD-dependent oxidoreductase [Methanobacteriaceae archaeon]|nr:NAD(P)/FAD-dependent oxidoreductase [Methanobacteriaceae archaeon]